MGVIKAERVAYETVMNGGGTYRITDLYPFGMAYEPVDGGGWAVGQGHGIPTERTDYHGTRVAVDYIAENVAGLTGHGYVGTWLDMDTGIVHVDAVELVPDRDSALALARYRGELAIYNLDTGETVYVHETVTV